MDKIPDFENKFFFPFGNQVIIKESKGFGKRFYTIAQLGKDDKDVIKLRVIQPVFGKTKNNKILHWRKGNKIYLKIKDIPSLRKVLDNVIQNKGIELKQDDKDQLIKQLAVELSDAKSTIKNLKEVKRTYFKQNKKKYEKELKTFHKIISKSKVTENEVQGFLNDKPLFFGLDYNPEQNLKKIPQKMAGKNRFDFFIEKYNGQSDIIELKRPDVFIFGKDGKISGELSKAVQQTIGYIEFCIQNWAYLQKEEGIIVNKPKGTIIIGKLRNKKEREKLEEFGYYFHHIDIITYDDFYEKAKTTLENAKKHLV